MFYSFLFSSGFDFHVRCYALPMGGRFHVVGGFVCHNDQTVLPPRHCGEKIGLQLFFLARPKFFLFFFKYFSISGFAGVNALQMLH